MPDFLRLHIIDILDILLVGILIFQVYKIIRGTAAVNIFIGILFVYFIWLIVKALHMQLLTTILDKVISVGVLALIVVFQQEIRRFLLQLGSRYTGEGKRKELFNAMFKPGQEIVTKQDIEEIVHACSRMSDRKTGALIAIERFASLAFIEETGDRVDARVHRRLIECVFKQSAPRWRHGYFGAVFRPLVALSPCLKVRVPPYFE